MINSSFDHSKTITVDEKSSANTQELDHTAPTFASNAAKSNKYVNTKSPSIHDKSILEPKNLFKGKLPLAHLRNKTFTELPKVYNNRMAIDNLNGGTKFT